MDSRAFLLLALAILAGVLAALGLAVVLRKAWLHVHEPRLQRLEDLVRPRLVMLMSGGDEGADELAALGGITGVEGRAVERLAVDFLPKVRGESHHALVQLLTARGVTDHAAHRALQPGAVGRARAAQLLGYLGSPLSRRVLTELTQDRNAEVRCVAARALGKIRDPESVPCLLHTIENRRAAVPVGIVTQALIQLGPLAFDGLRDGLRDPSPVVRALCAHLLGQLGAVVAVAELTAALDDDQALAVQTSAAHSLGLLGMPSSVAPLTRALAFGLPPALRAAAAQALGEVGAPEAVPAVAALLDDPEHLVAHNAVGALARMGPRGRAALEASAQTSLRGSAHAREALARAALEDARHPMLRAHEASA